MGFLDRFRAARRAFASPQDTAGSPADAPASADIAKRPDLPFPVRAAMAGALPGYFISDHFRELESCVEWVWVASTNKAKQYAQATPSIKVPGAVKKAFQSAPDAPDDDKTSNPNHPFLKLLRRPNPLTSGSIFMYQVGQQIELTGGCVVWVRRNQLNQPAELWPIPRGWLYYQRPTADYPYGYWRVTPAHNRWTGWYGGPSTSVNQWNLDVRDTLQVGWPSPLYPGEFQSSLAACSRLIDVATQTETAVAAKMRNAIFPAVLLSIVSANGQAADPLVQDQIDQLKAQVKAAYAGADNAGTTLIGNNIALQEFGQTMEAMQGTESRNQAREFVFNVFGVPPSATGAVEETSYAAFSAAMKAYISLSIDPVLMIVGEALSHLAGRTWPGIEIHYDARVYDDPQLQITRGAQILEAVKAGGATWNEWRVTQSLPRRPDCDELVQQPDPNAMAMGPDGQPVPGAGGGADGAVGAPPDDGEPFGMDLTPELPDSTTTGTPRPDLSRSGGRAFSFNGTGGH
jgi:phage portal protein BeeE